MKIPCPHCGAPLSPFYIQSIAGMIAGSKGRGKSKQRSRAQAQAAARARWSQRPLSSAKPTAKRSQNGREARQ